MKISARYYSYQELIDRTIQGLRDLFNCSCRPIVFMRQDGSLEYSGGEVWISEDAKRSYNQMQKHLTVLLELQSKTIIGLENTHEQQS